MGLDHGLPVDAPAAEVVLDSRIARRHWQTELQSGLTDPGDHDATHKPIAKLHCILHAIGDNNHAQVVKVRLLLGTKQGRDGGHVDATPALSHLFIYVGRSW